MKRGRDGRRSGFGTRSAANFWRDANFDGVYQSQTEATLCRATSDEKGVASCTYRVTNPPFRSGFGECYLDPGKETTGEHDHEPIRDCNFVNAVDGHGHTSILIQNKKRVEANSVADAFQVLELVATLEVTDFSRPHRTFRLHLLDISPGVLKAVTVGGLPADLGDFFDHPIGEGGELYVTALMPGRLPAGRQNLRVISQDQNGTREDRSDVFIDNRLVVEASPQQACPNQRVRLVICGFIDSEIRHISIDGVPVDLKRVRGYDGDPPRVDSRGRWAGTIIMLVTDSTTQGGEHKLLVQDSLGTQGQVIITFPERRIEVTPEQAIPVVISGSGFPVQDQGGPDYRLNVVYDHHLGQVSTGAETDTGGNFSVELTIPLVAGIPSRNIVDVEFKDDDGRVVVTSASHQIAEALIGLSVDSGPPGTSIVVTGKGFRRYTPVNLVRIGSLEVTPSPVPHTDLRGEFELEILVPQLETGVETVLVSAGGVFVSADFRVVNSPVASGAVSSVGEALANLGDSLVVCFHFRSDTKVWQFCDPLLPEESDLTNLVAGETYFIQVRETTGAILNGKPRNLTCVEGNCWNHVTW